MGFCFRVSGVRTWHFLLPVTGNHTLSAEGLGSCSPKVFLDDALADCQDPPGVPSRSGLLVSSTPEDPTMHLELKCIDEKTRHWSLYVNGLQVEEAVETKRPYSWLPVELAGVGAKATQDSFRGTTKLPDGSYTIATHFDATNLLSRLDVVRKFRFATGSIRHELGISYTLPGTWQITLNDQLAARTSHANSDDHASLDVDVPIKDRATPSCGSRKVETVRARIEMEFDTSKHHPMKKFQGERCDRWWYRVLVNKVEVPCSWRKEDGDLPGISVPQVLSDEFMAIKGLTGATEDGPDVGVGSEEPWTPGQEPRTPTSTFPDQEQGSSRHGDQGSPGSRVGELSASATAGEVLPQGVSFDAETVVYQANMKNRAGKFVFLGKFNTAKEAHEKYLEAFRVHFPGKQLYQEAPSKG